MKNKLHFFFISNKDQRHADNALSSFEHDKDNFLNDFAYFHFKNNFNDITSIKRYTVIQVIQMKH